MILITVIITIVVSALTLMLGLIKLFVLCIMLLLFLSLLLLDRGTNHAQTLAPPPRLCALVGSLGDCTRPHALVDSAQIAFALLRREGALF